MKYPKEVKEKIAIINEYEVSETLNKFNILHLYPGELCYPDGFYDSRFFELIGFNTQLMKKRNLGNRYDAIDFWDGIIISKSQVYADGAFLIKTEGFIEPVGLTQMICFRPAR